MLMLIPEIECFHCHQELVTWTDDDLVKIEKLMTKRSFESHFLLLL